MEGDGIRIVKNPARVPLFSQQVNPVGSHPGNPNAVQVIRQGEATMATAKKAGVYEDDEGKRYRVVAGTEVPEGWERVGDVDVSDAQKAANARQAKIQKRIEASAENAGGLVTRMVGPAPENKAMPPLDNKSGGGGDDSSGDPGGPTGAGSGS